ncbi:GNAT family N-acetyltransferase [Desulfitobacterium sp. AusDCA]|uniref:GNAT family N-acetyltransferase n=1 Tax=Desulfitobacterium sp. AusDCA TaxID=3240383 RepID=UPI003DA6DC45
MSQIYEVTAGKLKDVVEFLKENWADFSKRPTAKIEERELTYWKEVYRNKRIFYYRGGSEELISVLVLSQNNAVVTIEVLGVKPQYRHQGIGGQMLQFAEKAALMWSGEEINILFSGREEVAQIFPRFHNLGYISQCPINQKGTVLLAKRLKSIEK